MAEELRESALRGSDLAALERVVSGIIKQARFEIGHAIFHLTQRPAPVPECFVDDEAHCYARGYFDGIQAAVNAIPPDYTVALGTAPKRTSHPDPQPTSIQPKKKEKP